MSATTRHDREMNQTYPPPLSEKHDSGWLPPFVFLLGLVAWIAAGACWAVMDDGDGLDAARYQTLAIVLAVVGAGLVIIATLYDIASRH